MKVINALNTEQYDKIEGLSCIDYWQEKQFKLNPCFQPPCCKERKDEDIVGGHVIAFMQNPPRVYLVPMHRGCNSKGSDLSAFEVNESLCVEIPPEDEKAILDDPVNQHEIERQIQLIRLEMKEQVIRRSR